MSEDQNKKGGAENLKKKLGVGVSSKMPGPLPGLGNRPSKAPLPGMGARPSKAPLPGMGAKPSKAPLPGMGSKPAGGPLPGMGDQQPAAVPPFLKQEEPQPQGPSAEAVARDPFGQPPPSSRMTPSPSFAPNEGLISASTDSSVAFSESEAGKSNIPFIVGGVLIGVLALLFGYLAGTGKSSRVALNIAIRDALIVEYEIKNAAKLFLEVQTVASMALSKATKREYEHTHIAFLTQKVKGNPVKPTIFTERNYKNFDAAAVQWLMDYNNKWFKLDKLIQEHRKRTKYDEAALKAAKDEFQKLLVASYGVVFSRNAKAGNQFMANVVVLGAGTEEGMVKVQVDTGTFADERAIYNPEPETEDAELTKEPEKYVVPLGDESKRGLMQNATQSHFLKYSTRLKEITDLMKGMNELQNNLLSKLSEICSQDPVSLLGGIDPIEEFEEYKQRSAASAVPAS
ncbi:MAG: hypothetical protein GY847_08465 [Proteobacteria bacterium]|nr:hypothetical protein [Pseudomonadota bacterium]